jgi:kynurenine formamidase
MTVPFEDLFKKVCNWGRWGSDDELGTLNLIDGEAVRRGAACVKYGITRSLALPLDSRGPQTGAIPGRVNPLRTMISVNSPWSDDVVVMGLQAATHWDALAHMSHDGQLYNGFPASSTTAERGATRCGIHRVSSMVTRGVLLDVAQAKGVDRLEPGYAITADDLDTALEGARTVLEPGDVVLVRTGQMQVLKAREREAYSYPSPGLGLDTPAWFFERDVAAVATDNFTFEVVPCQIDEPFIPVHILHLVSMGLTQGQNFDLEGLAEACASSGQYTFLLDASPQPFTGGCGSPVNPVVIT